MIEAKSESFWNLIARDTEIKQVGTGFGFTEGPVYNRRGFLLFSDIPNERIHIWERGEMKVFREKSNKANGLTFDHQGRLLAAEGGGRVTRTEKNGSITVLAEEGLKAPNDLVYAIDGSVYFTDLTGGRVYQITRARSGVSGAPPRGEVRLALETPAPNGVALSPNQQQLYIADVKTSMVRAFTLAPDGALTKPRDFAPLRVDGLKTDESGNVWMASRTAIVVYDPTGRELGSITPPESPSNCCFGEGFRGLYITARKSLYHVPTKVPGTRTF
ncbi:MAG TPA: SMP-30/gluconolactonase/LRE family protein [Bryobacteraceae bacterium]|nr:SMP-30/gluconolactonase/LRE family protein [Bryobacteraceae bacterium]